MILPYAENLSIEYLSRVFDRNRISNCYKYFWFMAILDKISEDDWKDLNKTFLDSTAGNGNFLVNIYERKLKWCNSVNDSLIALKSIYGTELMDDNTNECKNRLFILFKNFCNNKNLIDNEFKNAQRRCKKILNHNIICTDTFKWDYENWCPIKENKALPLF